MCETAKGSFDSADDYRNIGIDGFDFFGTAYKLYNVPTAIVETGLPSKIYQYEFAYAGLQSEELSGVSQTLVFYGSYLEEHYEVEEAPILREEVLKLYESLDLTCEGEFVAPLKHKVSFCNTTPYVGLTEEEFFKAKSLPRNRELMKIMNNLDMGEHIGRGMRRIMNHLKKEDFEIK